MENIEDLKVPIIKKEAKLDITIDYNTSMAIAQTLFILASRWTKEKIDEFQRIVANKEKVTDIEMICYIYMENLYKKILEHAKDKDMVDYTSVTNAINPLMQNQ